MQLQLIPANLHILQSTFSTSSSPVPLSFHCKFTILPHNGSGFGVVTLQYVFQIKHFLGNAVHSPTVFASPRKVLLNRGFVRTRKASRVAEIVGNQMLRLAALAARNHDALQVRHPTDRVRVARVADVARVLELKLARGHKGFLVQLCGIAGHG